MLNNTQIHFYEENGYLALSTLLTAEEVECFCQVYDDFLSGKIESGRHRSDLSGQGDGRELITQIMRPSVLLPELGKSEMHRKALAIARRLSGEDMEVDFDMLIDKSPHTNTPTPWHQDEAYWPDLPDKRAASCWIALDPATKENGCMWFIPGSHKSSIRHHLQTGKAGALQCEADESEAVAVELPPGGCTFHHGRTIHYSRGNTTSHHRRAFIINMRPKKMIELERAHGFDHLGARKVRTKA